MKRLLAFILNLLLPGSAYVIINNKRGMGFGVSVLIYWFLALWSMWAVHDDVAEIYGHLILSIPTAVFSIMAAVDAYTSVVLGDCEGDC